MEDVLLLKHVAKMGGAGTLLQQKLEIFFSANAVASPQAGSSRRVDKLPATDMRALYAELLFRTHCMARASVPLMQLARRAIKRSAERRKHALLEYLGRHIREERRHAEWLLDDLAALGVERRALLSRTPPPVLAELVGAQYYWISHADPIALFGYMVVVESQAPSVESLVSFASAAGLSLSRFGTLVHHAKVDPHHTAELIELLDRVRLSVDESSLLSVSAFHTAALLGEAFSGELGPKSQPLARSRKVRASANSSR